MRKLLAITAAVFMVVGFSACASDTQSVPSSSITAEPVVVMTEETPVIDVPDALMLNHLPEELGGPVSSGITPQVEAVVLGDSAPQAYEVTVGASNHEIFVTLYVQQEEFESYPAERSTMTPSKSLEQMQVEEMLSNEQLITLSCLINAYGSFEQYVDFKYGGPRPEHTIPFVFSLLPPPTDVPSTEVKPGISVAGPWQLGGECFK